MKVTKMGIPENKRMRLLEYAKKYVGTRVKCYSCKTEFELEAQDKVAIIRVHKDDAVYVECAHCDSSIYIGDI